MGNNGSCDVCTGNTRNQMDIRRQKAAMYDRYNRSQMMSRTSNACETCKTVGNASLYDTGNTDRTANNCDDCGNSNRDKLRGMALAMGYVPWQNFECTYDVMEGFRAGTIFPELDKPFYGRRGMR